MVECIDHVLVCAVGYLSQTTAFTTPLQHTHAFQLSPCASNIVEMETSLSFYMHTHTHSCCAVAHVGQDWCQSDGCLPYRFYTVCYTLSSDFV